MNSKVIPEIVDADVAFHNAIMDVTNNQRLINMAQSLREQVYRYRVEYVKDLSYHDKLVAEHEALMNAILDGDVDKAKEITRKHIYDQEQIVIANVTKSREC